MNKFLLIMFSLVFTISCKAQQVRPLATNLFDVVSGDYLKDTNNDLDLFIGEYKATYQGRVTTLFITKEPHTLINFPGRIHHKDVLVIKFTIKNSLGSILQDTQNLSIQNNKIQSINFVPQIQSLGFSYSGNNCDIGNGLIYLKKVSPTQISWTYNPQTTVIDDVSCPPSVDKHIYLPDTQDLIFTKQ